MEMKEDDTVMMFFSGRLLAFIANFFKNNQDELLTNKDYLNMKNRAWYETKIVFDINDEEKVENIYKDE